MLLGVADPGSGRVLSPESDGGRDKEEVRDSLARCETRSLETPEPWVAAETQTLSLRLCLCGCLRLSVRPGECALEASFRNELSVR